MTTQQIAVQIKLEGAQQTQQGLRQVADGANQMQAALGKLQPSAAQLSGGLNLVGISAGQATNAMRQLPAQITDIVTGLASGQAPLTVLIQQGGQLRDSFGSVGNVLKALGSVISPVTVAIGGIAAAVGAVVYGLKGGQAEFDALNRSLVLSGNAAGRTAGQLSDMARSVGSIVGGQAAAADAMVQLAASGVAISVGMDKAAEAALRLERVGGPAVSQTVKAFAELARDPLNAAVKLNESTNFLTASLYRQIKALSDQGQTAKAAEIASTAFYAANTERSKQLEGQLGSIERGWLAVRDAIVKAKNAVLDIGRPSTAQSRFDANQAEIDNILAASRGKEPAEGTASALRIRQLRAMQEGLARLAYEESKLGIIQAANARQTREAIEGDEARTAALRAAAAEQRAIAALMAELNGLNADYADDLGRLQTLRTKGLLTEERYVQAITQLIQKQPFARALARDLAEAERDRTRAREEALRLQDRFLKDIERQQSAADRQLESMREEVALITGGEGARNALIQARLDDAAAQAEQTAQAVAADGFSQLEYDRLAALAQRLRQVADERRRLVAAAAQKDADEAALKSARDAANAWNAAAADIRQSLTDAFRRAFESGQDFGTAFARTLGNEIKARLATALYGAMADAVLSLVGVQVAGAAASAGGSAANWLQGANTAGTLYQAYNGQGLVGGAIGAVAASPYAYGAAIGTANVGAGSQAAMLAAQTGQFGAAGTVATSQAAAGAGSGAAASASSWGPYVAAVVAAYLVSDRAYRQGFTSANQDSSFWESPLSGEITNAVARGLDSLGIGSSRNNQIFSGAAGFNYLVGRGAPRVDATGVQGTLAAGDFTGQRFADIVQRGGLFRSDKRWTELADAGDELNRFFDSAARAVFDKAQQYGDALGLPVDSLARVTTDIRVALTDDAEANIKAIEQALSGYGDALVAGYADAIKPLAQYGETTVQTIERVSAAILGVNDVLQALGLAAIEASVQGGQAALDLQARFGGADALRTAAGGYLQAFYSDAERADLTRAAIGRTLGQAGIAGVPASRADFRALVEAQDPMTEQGQRAIAVLLGVADAFAQVTPAVDDAADAARRAADIARERSGLEIELLRLQGREADVRARLLEQIDPANRALQEQVWALQDQRAAAEAAAESARNLASAWASLTTGALGGVQSAYGSVAQVIDTERQRVKADADAQLAALRQRAEEVRGIYTGLIDTIGGALGAITDTVSGDGGRGRALSTLADALASLRAGRSVDLDAVGQAAGQAAKLGTDAFSTRADFERALAQTAEVLRSVQTAAGARMQSEGFVLAQEQAAVAADRDRQLAALDGQLEQARAAAGTLVSIDDGVRSVAQAIADLGSAIAAASLLQGGPGTPLAAGMAGRWLTSGNVQVWGSSGGAIASRQTGADGANTLIRGIDGSSFTVDQAQGWLRERIAQGDFAGIVARAMAAGVDSAGVDALLGLPAGTALAEALRRGLPSFAVGTPYVPRDMVAKVHQGERIIPAAINAELMRGTGSASLLAEVAALRAEVAALRGEQRAGLTVVAANTRRGAETLETWEAVGMPATAAT